MTSPDTIDPKVKARLAQERANLVALRLKSPRSGKSPVRCKKNGSPFKTALCANARFRGRKSGYAATITPSDLVWPSHCPVLGIELDYPTRSGQRGRGAAQPNWPSLDRWDPSKGYVPGNVFVISLRANVLKNNARADEILLVARYVMNKPKSQAGAEVLPLFPVAA